MKHLSDDRILSIFFLMDKKEYVLRNMQRDHKVLFIIHNYIMRGRKQRKKNYFIYYIERALLFRKVF